MGRLLIQEVVASTGCRLCGGSGRPGSAIVGEDVTRQAGLKPSGLKVTDQARALFEHADAVIDFSVATAAATHAALAAERGVVLVLGTSGIGAEDQAAVERAAAGTAIIQAPNMSRTMTVVLSLTQQVATILDGEFDVEILGKQHRGKVDAPSGTSIALGRAAAKGRGVDLDRRAIRERDGEIGPRPPGDIGFATVAGGEGIVEHTAMFAGPGERIELTHKISSRAIYTRGAVQAALWARDRPPGHYSMRDVLGLG